MLVIGVSAHTLIERWDNGAAYHVEAAPEVIPECDALLGAGLGESQKGIAAIPAGVAACFDSDLPARDMRANIILGAVCVQRRLWWSSTLRACKIVGGQAASDRT
jgi:hypothetical protein